MKISIHWFRRDLRIEDNAALSHALNAGLPVLPVFIFDDHILEELPPDDPRISFIYESLKKINGQLQQHSGGVKIVKGKPLQVWKELVNTYNVGKVYCNNDYEPYARERDREVDAFLSTKGIEFHSYKDQVIFEKDELVKRDGKPYTIFTPYKNKWLSQFHKEKDVKPHQLGHFNLVQFHEPFPGLAQLSFSQSSIQVRPFTLAALDDYPFTRDLPAVDSTSFLGPHLRFGTTSIRAVIKQLRHKDEMFLSELIWREFFMQILYHFPWVIDQNFRAKYNHIVWRNNEEEFQRWCRGQTGYPFVDAGMRQLNQTGFMHNRVRMAAASFLVKHLLIDWKWGEAYFAEKLLDYELSSNNGNWQWAAGTGCDAAPYFRIFNPISQLLKFDRKMLYVRKWIPELETPGYPEPMIEHASARKRALETYKAGLR